MLGLIQQFPAKPDVADFGKLAVGVVVFLLFLIYPPPPLLSSVVMNQHSWVRLLVLMTFFIFLLSRNGNGWEIVQVAFIFALFAISFVYKWQFAYYDGQMIGGLIPWSDAAAFNWDAHSLANGSLLSTWGARRPLFPGFLAVLLRTTGGDFIAAVIILALINVLAVWFVVRIVKQFYGTTAASFFLIFSFEFYIRFSGVTTSEQLGFAAGNLAFFFLLVGTYMRSLWRILFGLGLLTLGLNARVGALFILPALILWLGFFFRERMTVWRATGSAIIVVVAVFLLNIILVRVIAQPQSVPFSNYSYTLYGLASGNKGWTQVIRDYPNITEQEIMPLAIQKIRSEPTLLLKGMIGSFADYFSSERGAFSFGFPGSIYRSINLILWVLVISGLAYSIPKWWEGLQGLTLASFLGVLASIPLLPPFDSDGMRVHAATIPFSALWVVTGISALSIWLGKLIISSSRNWLVVTTLAHRLKSLLRFLELLITHKKEVDTGKSTGTYFQKPALFSAVLLIFLAVPAPLLLKALVEAPNSLDSSSEPMCEPGQELINGIKFKNINVILIPNEAAAESYVPFIRMIDFQRAINTASLYPLYPFLDAELLNLKEWDQLSFGSTADSLTSFKYVWVVSKFFIREGEFNLCGRATENKELQPYNFYYLEGTSVPITSLTISQENPTITQLIRWLYAVATGIVLFLMIRDSIGFKQHLMVENFYAAGIMILILPGLFVILYANGQLSSVPSSAQQRITLQMQNLIPVESNLYVLPLGIDWMSQADLGTSPAVVYENDIPLQSPNSMHLDIQEMGNGRYSVWEGKLYFSTSDNTDPRVNGRVYELEWPRPIPLSLQWLSYLMSISGIVLFFLNKYINQKNLRTGKPEIFLEENRADQE